MEQYAPTEWDHPAVEAAVFDPPAGFVLDRYYLEEREHIVYYRQENAERAVGVVGCRVLDSAASLETRTYLVVKAWRGSGNATVALAPWGKRFSRQGWRKAIVNVVEKGSDETNEVMVYLWQKVEGEWRRRQKYAIKSILDWEDEAGSSTIRWLTREKEPTRLRPAYRPSYRRSVMS